MRLGPTEWPGHPDWQLTFDFVPNAGELVCYGVAIQSKSFQPLTVRMLRQPNWATLMDSARRRAATRMRASADQVRGAIEESQGQVTESEINQARIDAEVLEYWASHAEGSRLGRRPRFQESHYEEVARVYDEHFAGGGKAPTQAVADKWGVPRSTANKWVSGARKRGWLTAAGRAGVPAGEFREGGMR